MPKIEIPGRYAAKVIEASLGEASTGTPYVYLSFETDEGQHIGAWLYVSDKAFENTLETLRETFGFDGNFENLGQLRAKACSITVEEEKDDKGKPRLRVRWINPPGGGGKPAPQGLAAQLTAKAARFGATPKAAPAGSAVADVPF